MRLASSRLPRVVSVRGKMMRGRQLSGRVLVALGLLLLGAFPPSVTGSDDEEQHAFGGRSLAEADSYYEAADGNDGGVDDVFDQEDMTTIVCIILVLIAVTIAFEKAKEWLEERWSSQETKVVLEKFFGELTVLGFLAMTMFICHQSGLLRAVSNATSKLDEEELIEYTENVHYALFSIMVFFVVQVLVLIRFASETGSQWIAMDKASQDSDESSKDADGTGSWTLSEAEVQAIGDMRRATWIFRFFPQLYNSRSEAILDHVIFKALRREFILDRATEPPFQPSSSLNDGTRLRNFNFGRYLATAQLRILAHVVEVETSAWLVLGVATILFYAVAFFVRENLFILAWIWALAGWFVFAFNVVFEKHLVNLRRSFLPRRIGSILYDSGPSRNDEGRDWDFKVFEEQGTASLPTWCDADPDHFVLNQQWWITKKLVGGKPNRQQTLFWMDRHGPHFYLLILQVNLIFTGIYVGLLMLTFFPVIVEQGAWVTATVYGIVSLIPAAGIAWNKKRLIATLTQVCSIGSYRKIQIINDVMRHQKTLNVVRTFIIVYNMHQSASEEDRVKPTLNRGTSALSVLSESERSQLDKTFDAIDLDGSGEISRGELKRLLERMGISMSDQSLERIVRALDADNDGSITREEFLNWYSSIAGERFSVEDLAHQLFAVFDVNGNGVVTIGEFKERFDVVTMNAFTLDEIGAVVHELDHDRDGTVSFEEFQHFLVRYMPEEMILKKQDSSDVYVGNSKALAPCFDFAKG